ncbi:MAG: hypothetical protein QHH80_09175 [Anaerolineae bacterium]|nr:hypothetical protein [Anaerolineae bacterium]
MPTAKPGTVTLIGSGEMTDAMARVYRVILGRIPGDARAVFLDTPAGFQLNADEISERAVDYFRTRLAIPLAVASFKDRRTLDDEVLDANLRLIARADLIFAGPGSPTYTVSQWQGHPVFVTCVRRLHDGAHLIFASAAAIAMSRFTLPVYEIYKVGADPHWVDGLDLLGPFGMPLAIMPHWNNAEGGTHDTRFCFMGAPRLAILERQLPEGVAILGIDEYTACILDLQANTGSVLGAGGVTIRRQGRDAVYLSGASFSLDALRTIGASPAARESRAPVPDAPPAPSLADELQRVRLLLERQPDDLAAGLFALYRLARALESATDAEQAQDARHVLAAGLSRLAQAAGDSDVAAPYVALCVAVRDELRKAGLWAQADAIRERLLALGIVLEDTPGGTRWRRRQGAKHTERSGQT